MSTYQGFLCSKQVKSWWWVQQQEFTVCQAHVWMRMFWESVWRFFHSFFTLAFLAMYGVWFFRHYSSQKDRRNSYARKTNIRQQ